MPLMTIQDLEAQENVRQPSSLPTSKFQENVDKLQEEAQIKQETEEPSGMQQFLAGQKTYNSLVSDVIDKIDPSTKFMDKFRPLDPNFNPTDHIKETDEPDFIRHIVATNSVEEINILRQRYQEEKEARHIIENSGWSGVLASVGGALADPVTIGAIAFAGPATAALGALKLGRLATIGARSAVTGAGGAITVGASEQTLERTQIAKPEEEKMNAVFWGTVIGALLGAGSGALTRNVVSKAKREVDELATVLNKPEMLTGEAKSAGAAAVREETAAGRKAAEAPINEPVVRWANAITSLGIRGLQPVKLRGLTNTFSRVNQLTNKLFKHQFVIGKNLEGVPQGENILDDAVRSAQMEAMRVGQEIEDVFRAVNNIPSGNITKEFYSKLTKNPNYMSRRKISEELSKAMRRGDDHSNPVIAKGAKNIRSRMQPYVKALQEEGLLGEALDLPTAVSYLTRHYNVDAILKNVDAFKDVLRKSFVRGAQHNATRIKELQEKLALGKELTPEENKLLEELNSLPEYQKKEKFNRDDTVEMESAIEDTVNNIIGARDRATEIERMLANTVGGKSSKFIKERSIQATDLELEPFLHNDVGNLIGNYMIRASAITGLKRSLREMGFDSLAEYHSALRQEFEELKSTLKSDKEIKKLTKDFNEAAELSDKMIRVATGTFKTKTKADSGLRLLSSLQASVYLGGIVISAIPDMVNGIFRNEIGEVLDELILKNARSWNTVKAVNEDIKDLNIGVEMEMERVLRSLVDPSFDYFEPTNWVDEVTDANRKIFSRASAMGYMNVITKRINGRTIAAKIYRTALGRKGYDVAEMARLGLSKEDLEDIKYAFKKYGEEIHGSFIGHTKSWRADPRAARARAKLESAVNNEVDATIITPSKSDLPFIAQTSSTAAMFFALKSFMFASTSKLLLPALQTMDGKKLFALLLSMSLGAYSRFLGMKIAGKDTDEMETEDWIAAGLTRGGATGLIVNVGDTAWNLFHGENPMWAGDRGTGLIFGPSIGLTKNISEGLARLSDGDVSESDSAFWQKLTPYANLWYIKLLLNQMNEDK